MNSPTRRRTRWRRALFMCGASTGGTLSLSKCSAIGRLVDGKLLLEDNRQTLTRTEYIYADGRLVAKKIQPITTTGANNGTVITTTYIHTDFLGSPVAETNSAGTVTRIERYTPYGEPSDLQLDVGPGFTGHATDVLTGLTNMQQRYFDAEIARFLVPDPVQTDPNSGASFNRYWYANNNPVLFIDPDGRCANPTDSRASNCPPVKPSCGDAMASCSILGDGIIRSNSSAENGSSDSEKLYASAEEFREQAIASDGSIESICPECIFLPIPPIFKYLFELRAGKALVNLGGEAVLKNGYYEVNGFKFSAYYYQKLWSTGRKVPSFRAKEVLGAAKMRVADATKPGFYKYVANGWEMIYNPTTKEVWHLVPIKK